MDATMQRPSPAQAFAYALAGAGGYPIIPAAEGQNERTRPPPRLAVPLGVDAAIIDRVII
jgi:hypothetical protein